jgi:hypothetical protein
VIRFDRSASLRFPLGDHDSTPQLRHGESAVSA